MIFRKASHRSTTDSQRHRVTLVTQLLWLRRAHHTDATGANLVFAAWTGRSQRLSPTSCSQSRPPADGTCTRTFLGFEEQGLQGPEAMMLFTAFTLQHAGDGGRHGGHRHNNALEFPSIRKHGTCTRPTSLTAENLCVAPSRPGRAGRQSAVQSVLEMLPKKCPWSPHGCLSRRAAHAHRRSPS